MTLPAIPPSIRVAVVGRCPADLWGISSSERIRRQLAAIGPFRFCEAAEALASGEPVLLLRADYLFEDRTIADLLAAAQTVLRAGPQSDAEAVAVRTDATCARAAFEVLEGAGNGREVSSVPSWRTETVESLSASYMRKLRKASPPQLWPIRAERAAELEAVLFGNSYKGVTDLVTKFVWPRPARLVTKFCSTRGISPNAVTSASLVLAAVATVLFAYGWFLTGLVLAWIMTFL
ncbi:MAG: CDP-alcohol phosphatidyltransferase family protein, partial [Candidatus Binatia bacterium]